MTRRSTGPLQLRVWKYFGNHGVRYFVLTAALTMMGSLYIFPFLCALQILDLTAIHTKMYLFSCIVARKVVPNKDRDSWKLRELWLCFKFFKTLERFLIIILFETYTNASYLDQTLSSKS